MDSIDLLPEYLPKNLYARLVMGQTPAMAQVSRKFRNRPGRLIRISSDKVLPSGEIIHRDFETWVFLLPEEREITPLVQQRINKLKQNEKNLLRTRLL